MKALNLFLNGAIKTTIGFITIAIIVRIIREPIVLNNILTICLLVVFVLVSFLIGSLVYDLVFNQDQK